MFNKKLQKFSIRKLTVGAASVLIGISFVSMRDNNTVHAAENSNEVSAVKTNDTLVSENNVKSNDEANNQIKDGQTDLSKDQVNTTNKQNNQKVESTEQDKTQAPDSKSNTEKTTQENKGEQPAKKVDNEADLQKTLDEAQKKLDYSQKLLDDAQFAEGKQLTLPDDLKKAFNDYYNIRKQLVGVEYGMDKLHSIEKEYNNKSDQARSMNNNEEAIELDERAQSVHAQYNKLYDEYLDVDGKTGEYREKFTNSFIKYRKSLVTPKLDFEERFDPLNMSSETQLRLNIFIVRVINNFRKQLNLAPVSLNSDAIKYSSEKLNKLYQGGLFNFTNNDQDLDKRRQYDEKIIESVDSGLEKEWGMNQLSTYMASDVGFTDDRAYPDDVENDFAYNDEGELKNYPLALIKQNLLQSIVNAIPPFDSNHSITYVSRKFTSDFVPINYIGWAEFSKEGLRSRSYIGQIVNPDHPQPVTDQQRDKADKDPQNHKLIYASDFATISEADLQKDSKFNKNANIAIPSIEELQKEVETNKKAVTSAKDALKKYQDSLNYQNNDGSKNTDTSDTINPTNTTSPNTEPTTPTTENTNNTQTSSSDQPTATEENMSAVAHVNDSDQPIALVNGKGEPSGQTIPANSNYKVLAKKTINGKTYYRLGTDQQWVAANAVTLNKANTSTEVTFATIAYIPVLKDHPTWKIALVDGNGHYTGKYLATNTKWKVLAAKTINGKTYYRLGTDQQWIPASFLQVKKTGVVKANPVKNHPTWKIALLNQNGEYTGEFVKPNTSWKVWDVQFINGCMMARIGNQAQWIPMEFVSWVK